MSTEMSHLVIDVSKWQGRIDWPRVAATSIVEGVMIKASDVCTTDRTFAANWTGAQQAGLSCGAYHFFRPYTPAEAQARHFISLFPNGYEGELPPALDVEIGAGWLGRTALTNAIWLWLQMVEQALGQRPAIYTRARLWREITLCPAWAAEYRLWVAHYTALSAPALPPGWRNYWLWQYSERGRVPGIKGYVDLNRWGGQAL